MSAYSFLATLLSDKYDVDPGVISPEATWEALGLDSMTVVEVLFDIEDELEIEVPEDRATFTTLGEAAAVLDGLVEAKKD